MTLKRILVTGGAGFLGSHLVDRLLALGHVVICVDNLSTGDKRNLRHLIAEPRFVFVRHDVTFPIHVEEVDEIYNFACPASPAHYQRDPIDTLKTSVIGAIHALELARLRGCRVLQASTSEIYGDPTEHPQHEGYWGNVNPVGPRSCYDESKRCAETLFVDYRRQHGVDARIARIFNSYGPRLLPGDGRVVSNFIVQALRGDPITIYGDGEQTRSFCYVDDLVGGVLRLMATDGISNPINLGNPSEVTIRELAEKVVTLVGSTSEIVYRPLPVDDPRRRKPDITRARIDLGWEPIVRLDDGLRTTIAYFDQFFREVA